MLALLAACGCKGTDAGRGRDRADPPKSQPAGRSWLDGPGPKLADVGVPKADSWGDARDPGYDQARDLQGVLAGWVESPDGRKAREVFIEVEPAGGEAAGAPVGTQTGRDGYFLIKGLKPDTAYQLTVRDKIDGRPVAGRVYARTGGPASQRVRLPLIENMALPGTPASSGGGVLDDRPPREPAGGRPEPKPVAEAPAAGEPPVRPNLTTEGPPGIARPPVTNISPPMVAQPPTREVRSPGGRFTLETPAGESREFPGGGPLLVVLTTTDRPPVAAARDLAARYGLKGLEVVGVVQDQGDRRAAADRFQRAERLNYLLYAEPGDQPGGLMRRFGVTSLPAAVLLDGGGKVLWQGDPSDAGLEPAVSQASGGR